MSICILSGLKLSTFAISFFTLSWTHSVEKIEWQEDWIINQNQLEIVEARVQGSGAGMEVPEGSNFVNGWWIYKPKNIKTNELLLATSNTNIQNWKICYDNSCSVLKNNEEQPIKIYPCE